MRKVRINFYDEELTVDLPQNFEFLKREISDLFRLEPSDVDELMIYFKESGLEGDQVILTSQNDFERCLNGSAGDVEIFLEVSENSRLYKVEMDFSKISKEEANEGLHSTVLRKEAIRREILEKEKLLKDLLETEKKERERKEREKAEVERARKEKFERIRMSEIMENKKLKKDKLKESIAKAVTEVVNSNIEKVREELINKTIIETTSAFDSVVKHGHLHEEKNSVRLSNIFESNLNLNKCEENKTNSSETTHRGIKCDGCGQYPIKGTRYKCTKCFDFDYCSNCEEANSQSHSHPFIKYRQPPNKKKKKCHQDQDYSFIESCKSKLEQIMIALGCNRNKQITLPKQQKLIFSSQEIKEGINNLKCPYAKKSNPDYTKLVQEMRKTFYLGNNIPDEEILSALEESK